MSTFIGKTGFQWWLGVVEDRKDPIMLGRCRVRIFGHHTDNKSDTPTDDLPWAIPSMPLDQRVDGIGLKEGDWCWGFFMDGSAAQKPVVVGFIPGINKDAADPEKGFYDPTTDLTPGSLPRPQEMDVSIQNRGGPFLYASQFRRMIEKLTPPDKVKLALNRVVTAMFDNRSAIPLTVPDISAAIVRGVDAVRKEGGVVQDALDDAKDFLTRNIQKLLDLFSLDALENGVKEAIDRFSNSNVLPGANVAFGELRKTFDIAKSKFDVNKDGKLDQDDIIKLIEDNLGDSGFFDGFIKTESSFPISRYPLENRLGEPSTSRLVRNEKIEQTVVDKKNKNLGTGEGAGHSAQDKTAESTSFPFIEPPPPYAAVYPYNHVHESESGHVIEVDDTPGAERLHWYHRSGTFCEMHPDGTEVNKVVKSQYNFITDDLFLATGKSINIDGKDAVRIKSGDDLNLLSGKNLNAEISSNLHLSTGESVYIYAKGGVIYIKGAKNVSIQAADDLDLVSGKAIHVRAPQIHLDGTIHAPNPPYKLAESPVSENDADKKTESSDSSSKQGFLLPTGIPGEVYKPVSDSNGKLVTLSADPSPHQLFEAIPTPALEAVKLVYDHDNGKKTTWEIVRPVHVPGKLIDTPSMIEQFEDGVRFLQRWSLPGGKYPKQMFWKTGSGMKLILDSSIRHMVKQPFNDKL